MLGLTRHSASKTFEWRAKKKTGEIFSVEVTLHRTQICGEERIMASVRDTTERKILENSIQTQFRFKNALNEILAVIISSDNCKTILSKTTNILGEILQVDRCLIYEVDIDKNLLAALTEWLNPNYSDISPTKGDYPIDLFKSGIAEMQRSGQYQVSHFDEINPVLLLDESDKLLHGAMNIKSALWYPFSFSARGYYLLVLNDTNKKRTWTNDEIDFLHAVSKHVCIALEKNRLLDEKKITDDLLIEQSHILRRVVDNSPCGIWMINVAGKMKFVNKTYCDLVGIPEANFLAVHHYAELYDEVTAGKCMKSDKETLELNKPYTFHESVKFVDGKYHDLEIVKSRITDEHCNPLGLIGISLDITERKQTQDELEERKEKYRGLSEASYEAIFLSENGVCIEQNQTAEKMFGYTSSEAIGRYGTEWISPEDREMVMNNMLIGFEDPYEVTAMKKDGTTFPCLLRGKMMNYKGKNVRVTSLSDITERKRAEKAEHESELRYRSLFKTSPSGIMIMDEHGIILEANKAISNSTHYSPDELVGFDIRRLSPQEQEHMVDENIQRILGGGNLEQEVLCKRKDGSICSFLLNEIAIILPSGRPGILSVSNDISERKNLELEKDRNLLVQEALNDLLHLSVDNLSLEESLEKVLTTILSLSFLSLENKGGIFLVDENQSELKLTTTSNLGAEIKTMCARVPFGKCLCGCAAANRQMLFSPCIDERHENRYAGIQPHGHFNVPILGPDNVLGVMVIYLAEHHKQKKIETDFLLAAADILSGLIQRKKNEEAIKNALVKAESANRLKTAFINNISHEVRTPLNGLLGFANLIVQPDVTEDEKIQYSSIMTSSSNRLMNTITSYIDISLISSASMVVKRDSFDLNQLMHQLYLQVQPLCDTKNLILHLETPEKTDGIKFFTDPELLHKILWHLLDNSIKFTDIGNINFGYEIQSGLYRFYIKDTGIGINKESLSQIFESFKKEELSLTRTYEGSGLGLTIVQELLQLLGSEVHVESEKGIGSTFFFFLPLEEISGALNSEKVIIDLPFQKPIILIVEDDTANRLYLETISRKYADMILLATNGKEAVDLCLTHPEISLVLMDIRMPVMDGLEATRVIKSSRKNLPIFAITAFANIGDEKKAVEAGCDEYLSKPLSREALLVKLKQHGMLK